MRKPRKNPKLTFNNIECIAITPNKNSLNDIKKRYSNIEFKSISATQFTGVDDGTEAIEEKKESWEGYYLPYVTIRDIAMLKTPKMADLQARINAESETLDKLLKSSDVSSFKARLITCKKCESKINKDYINNSICPVCGEELRAKSSANAIIKKKEKIQTLQSQLAGEIRKHSKEAPLKYLIAIPKEGK